MWRIYRSLPSLTAACAAAALGGCSRSILLPPGSPPRVAFSRSPTCTVAPRAGDAADLHPKKGSCSKSCPESSSYGFNRRLNTVKYGWHREFPPGCPAPGAPAGAVGGGSPILVASTAPLLCSALPKPSPAGHHPLHRAVLYASLPAERASPPPRPQPEQPYSSPQQHQSPCPKQHPRAGPRRCPCRGQQPLPSLRRARSCRGGCQPRCC